MTTKIELNIPEYLAGRLHLYNNQIPQILEFGLRELNAVEQSDYTGSDGVFEFLAGLPSPEDIIDFRPSVKLQYRINELIEKNRFQSLDQNEEKEWEHFQYLEHLVRMAKTKAYVKIKEKNI